MKPALTSLALVGLLSTSAFADVSKEDLKRLAQAGISDDVILSFVRSNGPAVKLTADDLVELKKAGLSDKVLERIQEPPGAVKVSVPAPSPPAVGTHVVHVPPPSVVAVPPPCCPWGPCRHVRVPRPCAPRIRVWFAW